MDFGLGVLKLGIIEFFGMPFFRYNALKNGYRRDVEERHLHPLRVLQCTMLNLNRDSKKQPKPYDYLQVMPLSIDSLPENKKRKQKLRPNLTKEEYLKAVG